MEWVQTLIPPAVVITVMIYIDKRTNDKFDKRIDDLRKQMSSEHHTLLSQVKETNQWLKEHIVDRNAHP